MSRITPPERPDSDGPQPYLVLSQQDNAMICWLEYLPDGRRVVTGSWCGTVRDWSLESGKQEGSMKHLVGISGLAVTRDGAKIISSDWGGWIQVWDVESHELVKKWIHTESGPEIAISPDDRLVAVGGKNVSIYTMEGRCVDSVKIGDSVWRMCFFPNGNKLACGTSSGIHVYDVNSGRLILGPLDTGWVSDVLWSRDGSMLFASDDEMIRCWNSDTGQQIGHPWTGHTHRISSLSLSPDGSIIASASNDETVRFWNATTGDPMGELQHDGVITVRFSPSGEFLASAGWDGKIYIWQVVECLGQSQTSNFQYVFPVACSTMI